MYCMYYYIYISVCISVVVACCIAMNAIHRFTHEIPLARICVTFTFYVISLRILIGIPIHVPVSHQHNHFIIPVTSCAALCCAMNVLRCIVCAMAAPSRNVSKHTKFINTQPNKTSLKCVVDTVSTH